MGESLIIDLKIFVTFNQVGINHVLELSKLFKYYKLKVNRDDLWIENYPSRTRTHDF